uniref:uncharacterized protein LOC100182097 isoform X2 n=1 Tax=Ciona intestinalis TaxID=7719 RepID=UPI00089DAA00|nr:uncharacterized protein LOC100182097 isoform X2 [Ciona intestinalis]|eukprot:XP_026690267.1 uncharacterized protein LOC100182097 isoform X2 [Ciona intestinalis]
MNRRFVHPSIYGQVYAPPQNQFLPAHCPILPPPGFILPNVCQVPLPLLSYPQLPYGLPDAYGRYTSCYIPQPPGYPPTTYNVAPPGMLHLRSPWPAMVEPPHPPPYPPLSYATQHTNTTQQPEPGTKCDGGHATGLATTAPLFDQQQNTRQKKRRQRNITNNQSKHIRKTSSNRIRYITSLRKINRSKHLMRSRRMSNNSHRKSVSVEPVELSSIAIETDHGEYESCDENDEITQDNEFVWDAKQSMDETNISEKQQFIHSNIEPHPKNPDYTIITNDKSFSYVNYNPDVLPTKLDRMWLQIGPVQKQNEKIPKTSTNINTSLDVAFKSPRSDERHSNKQTDSVNRNSAWKATGSGYKCCSDSNQPKKVVQPCQHLKSCLFCCCTPCLQKQGINRTFEANHNLEPIIQDDSEVWDESKNRATKKGDNNQDLNSSKSLVAGGESETLKLCVSGLWWDQSTNAGFTEAKVVSENSNSATSDAEQSVDSSEIEISGPFIQEMDDLVIVDTAPSRNVSSHHNEEYDINHNVSLNKESPACDTTKDRKKLDVDWEAIRSVVPQDYITRSYTDEGTAEVYDIGSNVVGGVSSSSLSSFVETRIADDDEAIVAVIDKNNATDIRNVHAGMGEENNMVNTSYDTSTPVRTVFTTVHGKRVMTPTTSARAGWGKQDVKLLLLSNRDNSKIDSKSSKDEDIANSGSKDESHLINENTISNAQSTSAATLVRNKPLLLTSQVRTSRSVLPSKKSKSVPTSPFRTSSIPQHLTLSRLSSSYYGTADTSPARFNNITCDGSPISYSVNPSNKSPDTTYLLTPASSVLEFLAPKSKIVSNEKQTQELKSQTHKIAQKSLVKSKTTSQLISKSNCQVLQKKTRKTMPRIVKKTNTLKQKQTSDSAYTSPSSCPSSRTITPGVSPDKPPVQLGSYGSKTVVKAKHKKSVSSRPKSSAARRNLTPNVDKESSKPVSTKVIFSEDSKSRSSKSSTTTDASLSIVTQSKIKVANLRLRQDEIKKKQLSKITSVTKPTTVVGKKPPSRRSPRIRKEKLSVTKKANQDLTDDTNNVQTNKKTGKSLEKSEICIKKSVLFDKSTENVLPSSCSGSKLTLISVGKTEVSSTLTRGRVKSSIKNIVNNLVNQSVYQKPETVSSPSLNALTCGSKPKAVQATEDEIAFPTSPQVRQRPSTVPTTPTQQVVCCRQLSASLSDVFYDTTVEESFLTSVCSFFPEPVKKPLQSSGEQSNRSKVQPTSTYIAFSQPTFTPPRTNLEMKKIPFRPNRTNHCVVDSSLKQQPRGQTLSKDLEDEVRQSAQLLLNSVSTNKSHCILSTTLEEVKQSPKVNLLNVNKDKVNSEQAFPDSSRRKSLDIATQTSEEEDSNIVKTSEQQTSSKLKLNVPPKKPPRSASPNSIPSVIKESRSKPKTPPVGINAKNTTQSENFPYYHLFPAFTGISPLRQPPFLSPTFIPVNIDHQFISSPTFPAFVVAGETQRSSISASSGNDSVSYQMPTIQQAYYHSSKGPSTSYAALGVHPGYPQPSRKKLVKTSRASLYKSNRGSKNTPVYPHVPHPRGPPSRKVNPIRRRRSYPGLLSSAAVAKARLSRRVATSNMRQQYISNNLNFSHPSGRIQRRPRFVRSSLTEDVILETLTKGALSPTFLTKPSTKKINKGSLNKKETNEATSIAGLPTKHGTKEVLKEENKNVDLIKDNLQEKDVLTAPIMSSGIKSGEEVPTGHHKIELNDISNQDQKKGHGKAKNPLSKNKTFNFC